MTKIAGRQLMPGPPAENSENKMTTFTLQKLRLGDAVRYVEIDGRVVVLNLESESYYVFDPVASSMWHQVMLSPDRAKILRLLKNQYAVDSERLGHDLDNFSRPASELVSSRSPLLLRR